VKEMTPYSQFIATSRYSRWLSSEGRRETWEETVDRLIKFWDNQVETRFAHTPFDDEWFGKYRGLIREAIINREVMPSMRSLMTAGEALNRDNVAGFNCAFVAVDELNTFSEILYILMCGTGVGFSVEASAVNKLPRVAEVFCETETTIVVKDSKLGWAGAFKQLIHLLIAGQVPEVDYSKVRPAGAELKTFGGRASGPEPLKELFDFTTNIFRNAAGRNLTPLECHDIVCKIAQVVVVGGVRRSALISLSDLNDISLRDAKSGQWWVSNPQRALANNSAVYNSKPSAEEFLREWGSLIESKSGERGIFNRSSLKRQFESIGRKYDPNIHYGTNPCTPGETPILTSEGYFPIENLVGKEVSVWNGERWSRVVPFATGVNPLCKVNLSDGSSLVCTPYHKWCVGGNFVEARNLEKGVVLDSFDFPVVQGGERMPVDAYSQGFYSGDGNKNREFSWVYKPKYGCIPRLCGKIDESELYKRKRWVHGPMMNKEYVPINAFLQDRINWLAGIFDADGCVVHNPNSKALQLSSVSKTFLDDVRLLLTTLGCKPKIGLMKASGKSSLPDGRGGCSDYDTRDCWRLNLTPTDLATLVKLGLKCERLCLDENNPQRSARRHVRVVSVEDSGEVAPTFCFTEPFSHRGVFNGIVTGQCGEIILRSKQFCNLTEVVVRPEETCSQLKKKVELATVLGTLQATLTDFRFLSKKWKQNTDEEALLGVSLTGVYDNPYMRRHFVDSTLIELREVAQKVNRVMSSEIGINASAAITTVKPSGTVSQLVDSASGIHPRYANYYIRRVRSDKKDPISQWLKDSGVPCEVDRYNPEAFVFSFPMAAPEGSLSGKDVDPIDHLTLWKSYKESWTDHNPSVTISVPENDWVKVGNWVYENFDMVGGLSFLPKDDHSYVQAPYEEITEEEFHNLVMKMPKTLDFTELTKYEHDDRTTGSGELACTAGQCAI